MKELSFCTDNKLRINSWDRDIAELTGQPASQVIGNKYFEVFPRITVDNKDALARVAKDGKTCSLKQYSFNCLYGCLKADIQIKPLKSPERNVEAIKVLIRPHAACSVVKKLDQSKRLIDIGKIASTLAHGVRNPLNAIKGAVVYLREKYSTEATLVEFTKIMEDEISRLETFISRFLSSSVLETEAVETDINSLLRRIEVFTSLQMYTRNIQSNWEFGTLPPIVINSFHLEQAVLNVINNAIEAMQTGGTLSIKTSVAERSGTHYVVIAISDTGPGMPGKKLDELSSDGGNSGKGFGLFITYEILKHYGGHIEIDGKKDVGTTITLFVPCRHAVKELS
jgi:two-component system, NtrC family, nitrogen regulation sensor histidine kinase GlnL